MADTIAKEAKFLSGYIYHNEKYTKNYGFKLLEKEEDKRNGFYAESYFKNGRVYVVYRGTDNLLSNPKESSKDVANDFIMLTKITPSQARNARLFYDYNARKYRNYPIYATGHSLGGSLAQMTAANVKELKAITFNAFGTAKIKGLDIKYPENVTNYGSAKDAVFNKNIDSHIGKVFVIGS